jgi:L-ribulose-5-phosphate 3-epimerase
MQAPFWKASGAVRESLQRDFDAIAAACSAVGIGLMVVPLVDAGRLDDAAQENDVVRFFESRRPALRALKVRVVFESDFPPTELRRFIARLDRDCFGVNYDIGNSAGIGFDPAEELAAYGERIDNVHVKDRVLGGTTVPLGTGNARFDTVFAALRGIDYRGLYILQTARAVDGDHAAALTRYRDLTTEWIRRHAA